MPSIAVIAGDGVGKEVIPAGLRVLEIVASLDVEMLPWGADYYAKTGTMMPEDALSRLDQHDAIAQVLADGAVRSGDLGGSASTEEVADALISALRASASARTSETGGTR